jgi:hypothetical protein
MTWTMFQDGWSNFTPVPLLFTRFEMCLLWLLWTTLWEGGSNIDNEPNKVIRNSKWSGLFLESFRGQILSKNKVQWLDLASCSWPPLVGLPLTKMVQVHCDFMVKYSKPWLSSSLKNYYWFFQYMGSDNGNVHKYLALFRYYVFWIILFSF